MNTLLEVPLNPSLLEPMTKAHLAGDQVTNGNQSTVNPVANPLNSIPTSTFDVNLLLSLKNSEDPLRNSLNNNATGTLAKMNQTANDNHDPPPFEDPSVPTLPPISSLQGYDRGPMVSSPTSSTWQNSRAIAPTATTTTTLLPFTKGDGITLNGEVIMDPNNPTSTTPIFHRRGAMTHYIPASNHSLLKEEEESEPEDTNNSSDYEMEQPVQRMSIPRETGTAEDNWMRHYRELQEFRNLHGENMKLKTDSPLDKWVRMQRFRARCGQLSKHRVQLLTNIGITINKKRNSSNSVSAANGTVGQRKKKTAETQEYNKRARKRRTDEDYVPSSHQNLAGAGYSPSTRSPIMDGDYTGRRYSQDGTPQAVGDSQYLQQQQQSYGGYDQSRQQQQQQQLQGADNNNNNNMTATLNTIRQQLASIANEMTETRRTLDNKLNEAFGRMETLQNQIIRLEMTAASTVNPSSSHNINASVSNTNSAASIADSRPK